MRAFWWVGCRVLRSWRRGRGCGYGRCSRHGGVAHRHGRGILRPGPVRRLRHSAVRAQLRQPRQGTHRDVSLQPTASGCVGSISTTCGESTGRRAGDAGVDDRPAVVPPCVPCTIYDYAARAIEVERRRAAPHRERSTRPVTIAQRRAGRSRRADAVGGSPSTHFAAFGSRSSRPASTARGWDFRVSGGGLRRDTYEFRQLAHVTLNRTALSAKYPTQHRMHTTGEDELFRGGCSRRFECI